MKDITYCRRLAPATFITLLAVLLPCLVSAAHGEKQADDRSSATLALGQRDLLPDIIVRESDLYDNDISTNIEPGRVHLRLSNGTANIGSGKLYLYGVLPDNGDGTQDVMQRVFREDSTWWDRLAGVFVFHPEHDHIHFENWAAYRLREVLDSNQVGPVVVEGAKTSFCILDLGVYDNSLPNFDPDGEFHSCASNVQGLSVGWIDVYTKGLPGQNIDITETPDGVYWLESEVDPDNQVLESDETNNISRVLVSIGGAGSIAMDSYEPNDSASATDSRPPGGPNSPNLGPCNPERVLQYLTIHESWNEDYFKFYANHQGSTDDYIRLEFVHTIGDLDLRLLDSNYFQVAQSNTTYNTEYISLNGLSEGWYYIRVFGYNGATNPDYTLTIDPPANNAPSVTVLSPPVGDTAIVHGLETFPMTWVFADPEDDHCWVTVSANTTPTLDGNEQLLPTSLYVDAELGSYVINSSYLDPNTYYIYAEITDGGTAAGDWSEGTLTIVEQSQFGNLTGTVTDSALAPVAGVEITVTGEAWSDSTAADGTFLIGSLAPGTYELNLSHDYYRDTSVASLTVIGNDTTMVDVVLEFQCPYVPGDVNNDGSDPNVDDLTYLVDYLFRGGPVPPVWGSANVDGLSEIDVADLTYLVDFLFRGGPAPHCP